MPQAIGNAIISLFMAIGPGAIALLPAASAAAIGGAFLLQLPSTGARLVVGRLEERRP